jgi:CRISPR-associated endonuclease/helicase Cas3
MSATLQPAWLKSVDTEPHHADWADDPAVIPAGQRDVGLGAIRKTLSSEPIAAADHDAFARRVLEKHTEIGDGEFGRISLVVCNTVDRACQTFDLLRTLAPTRQIELVHSRFRAAERSSWRDRFLSRAACTAGVDRIIVATQVVEAGVDISAGALVTELAPWPNLVQRFGRCARYRGAGAVHVVDRGRDDKAAAPYQAEALEAAWQALQTLAGLHGDLGTASLEALEDALDDDRRQALYPYQPRHLLLRNEFDELFDTTPDLTGADIDISRFIRSGEERDLLAFWLEVPRSRKGERPPAPSDRRKPHRGELCAIPFLRARDWLCGEETKSNPKPRLRQSMRAWAWDWIDGCWVVADRAALVPGRVVCVAADCGGYRLERGFDPECRDGVPPVSVPSVDTATEAQNLSDDSNGAENLSASAWKTIACHVREAAAQAESIAEAMGLNADLHKVLTLAATWHDVGKAHPAFQGTIRHQDRPDREDLAKAPGDAWLRPPGTYRIRDNSDSRPGLRHELASALALFAVLQRHRPRHPALLGPWIEALQLTGHPVPDEIPAAKEPTPCEQAVLACTAEDFDLLVYLVACHHGKVRVALHAGPKDQDYRDRGDGRGLPIRGIREGDVLPAMVLDGVGAPLPPATLTLAPAALGLSPQTGRSWRERTLGLSERFGPGALAWLEALIIAADRRASRLDTPDPALAPTTEAAR